MSSPKAFIEDMQREREELRQRLHALQAEKGNLHQNFEVVTPEQIASLRTRIAEIDVLIANVGLPSA